MATFKFDHDIDIHWNGYDIVGPAETVFSIPDQLYEEFESDLRSVEPSLTWLDTNEFQTLSNSVSASTLSATFPVALSTSTSGKTISLSSTTNPNGYVMIADGTGGVIFSPASTSSLTSVVGISPISTIISGGTVSVSIDTTALNVTDAVTATTLRTYVKNASGSTITKGQAVYVSGADGTNALIDLASASSELTSSKTLGIVSSTLTNNAFGYVVENGQLSNIDTSGTTAGASVWLGDTPGSLVFGAPPAEPSNSVYLGVVTKANASTGEILVKVQNGYELDELHDVSAGSPTDLDILQYKNSSGMWTKTGITAAGIVTTDGTQTLTNKTLTNPSANNIVGNYTVNVSATSTTVTLTSSSTYYQYITGTGTSTYVIRLPDTSTMTLGQGFEFNSNATTNTCTIQSSLGTTVLSIGPGHSYRISCISTSTNSTSAWDVEFVGASNITGSGSVALANSPSLNGMSISSTAVITGASIRYNPTTIATSGGSTAVSTSTNYYIRTTGTTTHRLNLSATPNVGLQYIIKNDSTGDVTVNASGGAVVATLKQGQGILLICLTVNGTLATDWAVHFLGGPSVTGTGSSVFSASPTLTGDVTLNAQGDIRFADSDSSNWVALQGASSIASNVTWTLPSADGTSGQVLSTDGSGALSWATGAGFSLISSQTISTGVSTVAKPANAKIAYLRLVSGGGGGSNRRAVATQSVGVSGGYGGGKVEFWVSASDFSSTINYSIGAGGSGAVSASFTSATIATSTVSGTSGGTTSFGPYSIAPQKQIPYSDVNEAIPGTAGTSSNDTTGDASGGYSGYLTAGGGSSGGHNSTRGIGAASAGGTILSKWSAITAGGGASAGTASTGATGSGTNGSTATTAGGGGGAGGGKLSTVTLTANVSSGDGGNGLYPGGGGGAGGLLIFSNATNLGAFTATVGSGGNGADGQIYVEWYG